VVRWPLVTPAPSSGEGYAVAPESVALSIAGGEVAQNG